MIGLLHVTGHETRGLWTGSAATDGRSCSHTTTESNPFAFQRPHLFSFPLFKLFSQMSVPSSPTRFAAQDDDAVRHPSALPRTRTVAIVKNHALPHRLDIEPRISEAGFEVRETAPRRHA